MNLYLLGGAFAAGMALLSGTYITGYRHALRNEQVNVLKADLAVIRKDLSVARKAEADANIRAVELETQQKVIEDDVESLKQEIAKRPAIDRCGLSERDAARLRGIGTKRR